MLARVTPTVPSEATVRLGRLLARTWQPALQEPGAARGQPDAAGYTTRRPASRTTSRTQLRQVQDRQPRLLGDLHADAPLSDHDQQPGTDPEAPRRRGTAPLMPRPGHG